MAAQRKQRDRKRFVQTPSRSIRLRTSKDGRFVMVDVVETWFFSTRYIAKLVQNAGNSKRADSLEQAPASADRVEG